MYAKLGNSEDNRIISRGTEEFNFSKVVSVISLDQYCEKNCITEGLIVKIDTQGGDWNVIKGMKNLLKRQDVVFVTEFTPWATEKIISPHDFLSQIGQDNYIFNLGNIAQFNSEYICGKYKKDSLFPILENDYLVFIDAINKSVAKYTDLLVIPKNFIKAEKLIKTLVCQSENVIP